LGSARIVSFIATSDPKRAKAFYQDVLGLKFVSEDPFAVVFDAAGTMLRIATVKAVIVAPYTVLGWDVSDICATVEQLSSRGVAFERYPGMKQDEAGIWNTPSGAKVAWFKDPEGHTLSITEFRG
jgi:catechol 2,3-dioxygenase-like lactoylglutathione lyase family enzyme